MMWALSWFGVGLILYLLGVWYEVNYEYEEYTIGEFMGFMLFYTAVGPFALIMFFDKLLQYFNSKGYKIKKREKPTKVDKALFEGNQKVYNNTAERVQEKLKEFKQ